MRQALFKTLGIDTSNPWATLQRLWARLRRSFSPSQRLYCPDCIYPMKALKFGRTTLDECRACAGIWLDAEELEALARIPQTPLNLIARYPANTDLVCVVPNARSCPRCKEPLLVTDLLDQDIATCQGCRGYWVGHGQMGPLIRAKRSPRVQGRRDLDWRCGYCQTVNREIDLCSSCGGPRHRTTGELG